MYKTIDLARFDKQLYNTNTSNTDMSEGRSSHAVLVNKEWLEFNIDRNSHITDDSGNFEAFKFKEDDVVEFEPHKDLESDRVDTECPFEAWKDIEESSTPQKANKSQIISQHETPVKEIDLSSHNKEEILLENLNKDEEKYTQTQNISEDHNINEFKIDPKERDQNEIKENSIPLKLEISLNNDTENITDSWVMQIIDENSTIQHENIDEEIEKLVEEQSKWIDQETESNIIKQNIAIIENDIINTKIEGLKDANKNAVENKELIQENVNIYSYDIKTKTESSSISLNPKNEIDMLNITPQIYNCKQSNEIETAPYTEIIKEQLFDLETKVDKKDNNEISKLNDKEELIDEENSSNKKLKEDLLLNETKELETEKFETNEKTSSENKALSNLSNEDINPEESHPQIITELEEETKDVVLPLKDEIKPKVIKEYKVELNFTPKEENVKIIEESKLPKTDMTSEIHHWDAELGDEDFEIPNNSSSPVNADFSTVTFKIIYPTTYGQNIYIVGSNKKFGGWDPKFSIYKLKWNIGNVWTLTWDKKTLPKRSEFKFVLINDDGKVQWEERFNRTFDQNYINYALRTSKSMDSQGYALIDQRTAKLEYYPSKENVTLTFKWAM